ncbi:hypothetical protein GA0115246_108332 [Streptomyces sp. SolWspMP-sol7th]|nr:hypothetical protein GA0115246_108332 [Streptomyces sp. SolWspMP-sol7th]
MSFSTVFCVQAGLPFSVWPTVNAALNIVFGCGSLQLPSGRRQRGISTSVSRGTETATACRWSA